LYLQHFEYLLSTSKHARYNALRTFQKSSIVRKLLYAFRSGLFDPTVVPVVVGMYLDGTASCKLTAYRYASACLDGAVEFSGRDQASPVVSSHCTLSKWVPPLSLKALTAIPQAICPRRCRLQLIHHRPRPLQRSSLQSWPNCYKIPVALSSYMNPSHCIAFWSFSFPATQHTTSSFPACNSSNPAL